MISDDPPLHVPYPGAAHPAYGPADLITIRHWLDWLDAAHLVFRYPAGAFTAGCELAHPERGRPRTRVFSRIEVSTPAPWSGRRFMYRFNVALDDLGRSVASARVTRWYEPYGATQRAMARLPGGDGDAR